MSTLPGIPNHTFRQRVGRLSETPYAARETARTGVGYGVERHNLYAEPDAPRWPGAARLAVILVPSVVLWVIIGAALTVLLICSAREAGYAAAHPHPVVEAERS